MNLEVLFLLAQDWNFWPLELDHTKKRSNSAAVTSRVLGFGEDVRLGRRSAVIYFFIYACVFVLVLRYVCGQVVRLGIVLSSRS